MIRLRQELSKPFVAVIPLFEQEDLEFVGMRQSLIKRLRQNGIPVFPTAERAAKVLLRLQRVHRFLDHE
jgi:hypothetical protein